jgi:hypothetical protein
MRMQVMMGEGVVDGRGIWKEEAIWRRLSVGSWVPLMAISPVGVEMVCPLASLVESGLVNSTLRCRLLTGEEFGCGVVMLTTSPKRDMAFWIVVGQTELGAVMSMMVGDGGGGGGEEGFEVEGVLMLEGLADLYSMILRLGSMSRYPAWVWRRWERNLSGVRLELMGFVMVEVGEMRSMSWDSWKRMGGEAV